MEAEGRPPLGRRPKAASFVLAPNKAHVLAFNTAHFSRLDTADVLAFNKAHVLRLNNKIRPVFRANTKETTKGGGRRPPPLWRRPKAASFVLALNKAHVLALNTAHILRLNKTDVFALNKAQCSLVSD